MSAQRLDIALGSSYLAKGYWLLYLGVAALLASRYELAWWQWLMFGVLCIWSMSMFRVREIKTVGIVAPRHEEYWQLSIMDDDELQIWQAKLISIKDADICIVARFVVTEPFSREVVVRIYPDQVDKQAWRQLKALVSFG